MESGNDRMVRECLALTKTLTTMIQEQMTASKAYTETLTAITNRNLDLMEKIVGLVLIGNPNPGSAPSVEGAAESPSELDRLMSMQWEQTLTPDPTRDTLEREEMEDQYLQTTIRKMRQSDPSYGYGAMDQMAREIVTGNPSPFPRIDTSEIDPET